MADHLLRGRQQKGNPWPPLHCTPGMCEASCNELLVPLHIPQAEKGVYDCVRCVFLSLPFSVGRGAKRRTTRVCLKVDGPQDYCFSFSSRIPFETNPKKVGTPKNHDAQRSWEASGWAPPCSHRRAPASHRGPGSKRRRSLGGSGAGKAPLPRVERRCFFLRNGMQLN